MPQATPLAVREQIIVLHLQQYPATVISKQLQVNLGSVRRLVQRYKADSIWCLQPDYHHCGAKKPGSQSSPAQGRVMAQAAASALGCPFHSPAVDYTLWAGAGNAGGAHTVKLDA